MTKLNTYLNFAGNTEEAFTFTNPYLARSSHPLFVSRTYRWKACKSLKGTRTKSCTFVCQSKGDMLMASDSLESLGQKLVQGNNIYISIHPDSKAEADRIFKALSADGTIEVPIADQLWGDYYGHFKDKFGVRWMVNYSYPKNK